MKFFPPDNFGESETQCKNFVVTFVSTYCYVAKMGPPIVDLLWSVMKDLSIQWNPTCSQTPWFALMCIPNNNQSKLPGRNWKKLPHSGGLGGEI